MQELVFDSGAVAWREAPTPQLGGPLEALVRPVAVARCDLDAAIVRGKVPVGRPFALGHEFVADVLATGEGVRDVSPGDRVIVPFQISCGACPRCLRGHTGSCSAVPELAAFGLAPFSNHEYGGALSDVVRVPFADAMLVPLPPGVDPAFAAAAGDNLADGYRAVAGPLSLEPGAGVLVVGGGAPSVGLYAVAAARALGASDVVYVDLSAERLEAARALGARAVEARAEPGLRLGRFAVTVDASARGPGLHFALASTEPEGACTSVGIYYADTPMPLLSMYTKGVRFLTGRVHARAHLPEALRLIAAGLLDPRPVASRVVAWADAAEAYAEPALKLVVTRPEARAPGPG